jgi:putative transposase
MTPCAWGPAEVRFHTLPGRAGCRPGRDDARARGTVSPLRLPVNPDLLEARRSCDECGSRAPAVAAGRRAGAPPTTTTPRGGQARCGPTDFVFDPCANRQGAEVLDGDRRVDAGIPGHRRGGRDPLRPRHRRLTQLVSVHGRRATCARTTGRSFVARAVLRWLAETQIETAFIDPGKPWQNGADESLNGKLRDEYLIAERFKVRCRALHHDRNEITGRGAF